MDADAVVAAVNHDGDSDSTGAVAGNIMGAMLGMQGIGEEFLQALELRDLLCELAIRLTKRLLPYAVRVMAKI